MDAVSTVVVMVLVPCDRESRMARAARLAVALAALALSYDGCSRASHLVTRDGLGLAEARMDGFCLSREATTSPEEQITAIGAECSGLLTPMPTRATLMG
jgi:hypothetical protein